MESVKETLFEAFAQGEILTEDSTYSKMTEEFANIEDKAKNGRFDIDDISCLQYAAMQAGFYAGMNAMRALLVR